MLLPAESSRPPLSLWGLFSLFCREDIYCLMGCSKKCMSCGQNVLSVCTIVRTFWVAYVRSFSWLYWWWSLEEQGHTIYCHFGVLVLNFLVYKSLKPIHYSGNLTTSSDSPAAAAVAASPSSSSLMLVTSFAGNTLRRLFISLWMYVSECVCVTRPGFQHFIVVRSISKKQKSVVHTKVAIPTKPNPANTDTTHSGSSISSASCRFFFLFFRLNRETK